jgi:hypothetical protein
MLHAWQRFTLAPAAVEVKFCPQGPGCTIDNLIGPKSVAGIMGNGSVIASICWKWQGELVLAQTFGTMESSKIRG